MTTSTRILFAALTLGTAAPSLAAVTTYTDRATFTAATGATTVEDFTDTAHFPITSGILNSATTEAGLVAGEILPGVTYSTPVGTGNFFNIDAGGGYVGGFLDSLDSPRALTITFDALQGAFGFDTNQLMGSFTVSIFGDTDLIYTDAFARPSSTAMQFFGFANSEASIRSVVIQGNRDDTPFNYALDNFTFDGSAVDGAVPEPATWAMLIVGFGLVGNAARRRRLQGTHHTA